jgi:hypothetical protein
MTLTPKEKAEAIEKEIKFPLYHNCTTIEKGIAIRIQEKIIEKLSEYGIKSEYENEILIELTKQKT